MLHTMFVLDQDFLRKHLVQFLEEQGLLPETALGNDVRQALATPHKLLAPPSAIISSQQIPAGIWALIPMYVARYCAPDVNPELISCVALSCECFLCALDLLDDVEDDDSTTLRQQLGDARLLNVATALLALASQSLLSATRHGLSNERLFSLLAVLHAKWLRATQGQHRDLLVEKQAMQDISSEECLRITEDKSGSLVSLACSLATISTSAPEQIRDLFASAGLQVGIAYQLDNDIRDLSTLLDPSLASGDDTYKTDLARNKKTLPIVLAAERLAYHQQHASPVSSVGAQNAYLSQSYEEALKASLAVSFYYRSRAVTILKEIEVASGVQTSPELRFLLSLDGLPQ
jgi:geranylgeranyl pyrophosphate synthase